MSPFVPLKHNRASCFVTNFVVHHVANYNSCCIIYNMSSEKEAHEVISYLVGYMLVCSHSKDLLVNGCVRFESKNKKISDNTMSTIRLKNRLCDAFKVVPNPKSSAHLPYVCKHPLLFHPIPPTIFKTSLLSHTVMNTQHVVTPS